MKFEDPKNLLVLGVQDSRGTAVLNLKVGNEHEKPNIAVHECSPTNYASLALLTVWLCLVAKKVSTTKTKAVALFTDVLDTFLGI